MAKRQDGGIRLRPVGTRKHRQNAPAYSPAGTGCPAFEQAVENLYKGQNEESFWTLMGALNYALEMETHVLVPLRTALTVHNTPAPWTEHPVPTAKAKDLQLWTLRNEKGRTWLPMFTSAAAACADRSTSARPMADYTLQDAMELALSTEGIDGVVLDPWSHSATLDGALLNGLLHAGHTPKDPVMRKRMPERKPPARATGRRLWNALKKQPSLAAPWDLPCWQTVFIRAAAPARTVPRPAACGRKQQTAARSYPTLHWAMTALPGATMAGHFCITAVPAPTQPICRISSTLRRCACVAQTETRYTSRKKALSLAAEARQGFSIKAREHEPDAEQWLAEADQLIRELTSELPARATAYDMESLQLD